MTRVLVAGVGNVFLGDDAFGVEVARELLRRPAQARVTVRDFGTRGLDLAYTLADGFDALLLVDTVQRGHAPGTLSVIEPDFAADRQDQELLGPGHGVDPCRVATLVQALGGTMPVTRLVGCEPLGFGTEDEPMLELSAPVRDAVLRAIPLVEQVLLELSGGAS
ncbi:MAG TPA: hydrogenase maturation protease [Polyangiaceae bacterium]|jgi:hydrogenase maturation protease|nr:hydrogenase maturation protease [Polyangiaceae bacterium]